MTQACAARSHTFTFLNVNMLPAKAAQLYTEQETYVTLSIDNRQQMGDGEMELEMCCTSQTP